MPDALQSALRDRVDPESLLKDLALVAVIYWKIRTLSEPLSVLALVVVIVAIVILASWLAETYDLLSAVKSLALGGVATTYGAALSVFGGVPMVVSVGLLVVGVWFLFDAVQVVRHDGLYADGSGPRGGRIVSRDDVARKVDYALRDNPLTKRELREKLDFEESAVDDALATLDERGVLTRGRSELRASRTPDEGELSRSRGSSAQSDGAPAAWRARSPSSCGDEWPRWLLTSYAGFSLSEAPTGSARRGRRRPKPAGITTGTIF